MSKACGDIRVTPEHPVMLSRFVARRVPSRYKGGPNGGAATRRASEAHARDHSRTKAEGRRIRRDRARGDPRAAHCGRDSDFSVSAIQHSVRLDDGDIAHRRLPFRIEVYLRLQPLLLPVLAAAVHWA